MGVCNCSMFCCALLCVHFGIAIILVGWRGLVALLSLSSWCLVVVERLFLAVPRGCLQFVIVVFPDHTHLLFIQVSGGNSSVPQIRVRSRELFFPNSQPKNMLCVLKTTVSMIWFLLAPKTRV